MRSDETEISFKTTRIGFQPLDAQAENVLITFSAEGVPIASTKLSASGLRALRLGTC
jgi:hypothetical protein